MLAIFVGEPNAAAPEPLSLLRSARAAMRSGEIIWSYEERGERAASGEPRARTFVSRYAVNGDFIFEERGDQDGWVEFQPDGTPIQKFPLLWLVNDEGVLMHAEPGLFTTPVLAA